MLVYGFHPVREALRKRPHEVARVFMAERRSGRRAEEVKRLCQRQGARLELVPSSRLAGMVDGVHNGFVVELSEHAVTTSGGDAQLVVLLEDVQDPRNLGALLRVCEGAGVGRVLLRDRGSSPLSSAVSKTSAGAAEWLAVDRVPNTVAAMNSYRDEGFWVYGAAAEGDPIWDVDLTGKVMFCIGGEEKGLRQRTRKECDRLVSLPMQGRVSSLNVATAASALLFEALRQRQK